MQKTLNVPLIIVLIWAVLAVVHLLIVPIPHTVSLCIVLATILWFIIWLAKASRA